MDESTTDKLHEFVDESYYKLEPDYHIPKYVEELRLNSRIHSVFNYY